MGGPLSVIFSDIYMTKMERDIMHPFNPIFYHRYVDDIYTRQKINKKDETMEYMKLKYAGKKQRYQRIGVLESLKCIREIQYQQIYIDLNEYRRALTRKFKS